MLVKCSFCRKEYDGAGAYEQPLGSWHGNLNIVLRSTIRNPPADMLTDRGTELSDANEPIEDSDSDYESDPARDPAPSEHDVPEDRFGQEQEKEGLEDNRYRVGAE